MSQQIGVLTTTTYNMAARWGLTFARLAGFKQCAVDTSRNAQQCTACHCTLPTSAFTASQLHRNGSGRCIMCVEIGPVVEACLFNRCAYCKAVTYDSLTKEHLIPKSLGGTWSPKLICHGCNRERGNDMNFGPFKELIKKFPVLEDRADKRAMSAWRWKNNFLRPAVKTVLCNVLEHAHTHKTAVPLIVSFAAATTTQST